MEVSKMPRKKYREILKPDVKPAWKAPKGHKQGNSYGRTSFDDKRHESKVNERSEFKKEQNDHESL
jgi:hypothetical protein